MEVYEQIVACFLSVPDVHLWEDAQVLFRRVASGRPKHWLLPLQTCEAVGGTREQAIPAAVAIACAHIGIILVDDMLDSDPRGEYKRIGKSAASNLACAFQSASLGALNLADVQLDARLAALNGLNAMFFTTALGQFWDTQSPSDETAYWRVVQTKSSPFFGAALQIGGLAGGGSIEIADHLRELGGLYGEAIQIHDDLNDSMAVPANPDWIQGRSPLPILFAKQVDHSQRDRFLKLCENISDAGALTEAQEILIQCGAVSYCVDQLLRRYMSARELLDAVTLQHRDVLEDLFQGVVTPVWKLFEAMGEAPPDLPTLKEMAAPG
jgi:geranylgeranyl diphosphate synthase type I